ncbi:hypothetical protein [Lyngbya aestuarii]|uniref:hypothetical protein n=1 Tax=Lyngbya aestuarii TaxID=118322 RepID=UPI00403DB397
MTIEHESEDLAMKDNTSLVRLARAISLSQGQFSLILVCSKSPMLGLQVVEKLQEISSVRIQKVVVNSSIKTLFTSILNAVEEPLPPALMVFGLESVTAIEQVLSATNLVRDEFRKQFPFPLVLWINDDILQKLIRLAPDFKAWDLNPIRFEFASSNSLGWAGITA